MRVKRQKQHRRLLRFYRIVYQLNPAYKVLLDGNFIHAAVQQKADLAVQVARVLLDEPTKLLVSSCVIAELSALGPSLAASCAYAHQHRLVKCGHTPALPASECIASLVGVKNRHQYFVASQDTELRARLRAVPGTPLMYLTRTLIVMEHTSEESMAQLEKIEAKKAAPTRTERRHIEERRVKEKRARVRLEPGAAADAADAAGGVRAASIAAASISVPGGREAPVAGSAAGGSMEDSSGESGGDSCDERASAGPGDSASTRDPGRPRGPPAAGLATLGGGGGAQGRPPRKKRKGPAGPNPLSVKKKKKERVRAPPALLPARGRASGSGVVDRAGEAAAPAAAAVAGGVIAEEVAVHESAQGGASRKRKRRRRRPGQPGDAPAPGAPGGYNGDDSDNSDEENA
jgi:rRNA-processing protein FCF1